MAKTHTPAAQKPAHDAELNAAAELILHHMFDLDPMWAEYINIARSELHRSDWQVLGGWVAYVLDNGAHMAMPSRPEFQPGYMPRGHEVPCEACGKPFKVRWGGQRFCGNECAAQHRSGGTATSVPTEAPPDA